MSQFQMFPGIANTFFPPIAIILCPLGSYLPFRDSYENYKMHIHKCFCIISGTLSYKSLLQDYSLISDMVYTFMSIRACCKLSKSSKHLVNIYYGPTCIALSDRNIMLRKINSLPSWSLHPSERD